MTEPADKYIQQVTQYTAQSLSWLKKSYGPAISADIAVQCATRMALSAALLCAAEKVNIKIDPDRNSIELNNEKNSSFPFQVKTEN